MTESSSSLFEASSQSSSSATPPDCVFGIKLQMQMSEYNFRDDPEHPERPIRPTAWRMRIAVLEVNNITPDIFVYNLGDLDPEEGTTRKYFQNIASPTDIVEYPVGMPLAGETPEFFRLGSIDFVHRSLDVLDATWDAIKLDVAELIEASARLCELEVKETYTAGILDEAEAVPGAESEEDSSGTSESSIALECPDDDVTQITVMESTDPEFPAGAVLSEVGSINGNCERTWAVTGAVLGHDLTLVTSLVTHVVDLTIDDGGPPAITDQVGLAHNYGAIFNYAYSPTQEHTIRIAGA